MNTILSVYTKHIKYTSESKDNESLKCDRIAVYNCTFRQTDYGSVIIIRPTLQTILELYPKGITHIIHTTFDK